jgi:hypothetical protein
MAANAPFALKAAVWFRRARFVIFQSVSRGPKRGAKKWFASGEPTRPPEAASQPRAQDSNAPANWIATFAKSKRSAVQPERCRPRPPSSHRQGRRSRRPWQAEAGCAIALFARGRCRLLHRPFLSLTPRLLAVRELDAGTLDRRLLTDTAPPPYRRSGQAGRWPLQQATTFTASLPAWAEGVLATWAA